MRRFPYKLGWAMAGLLAATLFLNAAAALADPYLEYYARTIVVRHDMGMTGHFVARITITPRVTVSEDGVAHITVSLAREEVERSNPGGLARVTWEMDLADCDSDVSIQSIKVMLLGRTVTAKNGRVELRGSGLGTVYVQYKWLDNERSLSFDYAQLLGVDGSAERPRMARMVTLTVFETPEEAVARRVSEMKALAEKSTALEESVKEAQTRSRAMARDADAQLKKVDELARAVMSARSREERARLLAAAGNANDDAKKVIDASRSTGAEARRLALEHAQLRQEMEAVASDIRRMTKPAANGDGKVAEK